MDRRGFFGALVACAASLVGMKQCVRRTPRDVARELVARAKANTVLTISSTNWSIKWPKLSYRLPSVEAVDAAIYRVGHMGPTIRG